VSVLLNAGYGLAALLGWPYLVYRRLSRGPGTIRLSERLGAVPRRSVATHCVWIHGVSLGEINAARTLIDELRRRSPATAIAVSSTTQTGLDRARQLYPKLTVFRFPVDLSPVIERVLRRVRPSLIMLMELEAWPNLIEVAARRGIPVLIANGRVTERPSMQRFRWPVMRGLARRMFGKLSWVGAQDETYAARFLALGVPAERLTVTGSLKYDAADLADRIEGQEQLAAAMGIDATRPLWTCGSTGPGEEAMILTAYSRVRAEFPALQLALVPRKPERFDEVAAVIERHGFRCVRRSRCSAARGGPGAGGAPEPVHSGGGQVETGSGSGSARPAGDAPVFLGDTMGELRKFYALAQIVFIGRTLTPLGGSDVMEVAGLARPMIVGPHTENFAEAVELLASEGACLRVSSGEELPTAVTTLLADPPYGRRMGEAARRAIVSRRGATERTVTELLARLP
jgi:3-deoxy-D-manno-octulosonic-acid transferase